MTSTGDDPLTYSMDTKNANKEYRTTPEYAEYQREGFWASNDGKVMPFNTGKAGVATLHHTWHG